MKPHHALLGFALLLLAAACAHSLQDAHSTYAPSAEESAWVREQLLTIKREVATFGAIGDELRWKIADCAAPPTPTTEEMKVRNKLKQLKMSASDDRSTHGRALYRLMVRDEAAYAKAGTIAPADGQVIVKATYKPLLLNEARPHSYKQAARGADGKWYHEGAPSDLYILFRTDRKGIQTDAGWVYGVVSKDRDEVLAQGLISNCMGCHQKNAPDRLFGIRTN